MSLANKLKETKQMKTSSTYILLVKIFTQRFMHFFVQTLVRKRHIFYISYNVNHVQIPH